MRVEGNEQWLEEKRKRTARKWVENFGRTLHKERGQNRYFIDEDGPMTLQDVERWLLTEHNKRFSGKTLKQW